jgi:RecJ-like exonuclease
MSLVSEQETSFEGIVTRSFNAKGSFVSTLTNGSTSVDVISSEPLESGSYCKVAGVLGEYQGRPQIRTNSINRFPENEKNRFLLTVMKNADAKATLAAYQPLVADGITAKLDSALSNAARKLLSAKTLNRFVLLRFHGDADGVSGAFALTKLCRMQAIQQNSAVYSVGEAMRDLQLVHHEFIPLVVLLDFGSNPESLEGLRLLKAGGCEVLIIDHHPPSPKISEVATVFVSPWAVVSSEGEANKNDDVSRYPAGYLAIEIARLCGHNEAAAFAPVSCAGDKSTILPVSDADRDKALVLDYMASYSGFGNNLDFYNSVMSKSELFFSMLYQAREKIEQIYESVKRTLREKEVGGVRIAIIDLERLSKKHEFPSKGKIATRVFESINSDKPLVVLGFADKSVIFRINQPANDRGIFADKIIAELKTTMKDFIEAGGGHAKAAALRVREDFAKDVVEEIVKVIERLLA